jgi:hypothetical protein
VRTLPLPRKGSQWVDNDDNSYVYVINVEEGAFQSRVYVQYSTIGGVKQVGEFDLDDFHRYFTHLVD